MQILQHFNKTKPSDLIIYRLKKKEWNTFINKLTNDFRISYISDAELEEKANSASMTKSDFFHNYILPDAPTIISGDFGELLSLFAVLENYENKAITFSSQ